MMRGAATESFRTTSHGCFRLLEAQQGTLTETQGEDVWSYESPILVERRQDGRSEAESCEIRLGHDFETAPLTTSNHRQFHKLGASLSELGMVAALGVQ